jgi:hypothetical protein
MKITFIYSYFCKVMIKKLIIPVLCLILPTSCTVVRPGEVGVKQRMGKLLTKLQLKVQLCLILLLVKLLGFYSNK